MTKRRISRHSFPSDLVQPLSPEEWDEIEALCERRLDEVFRGELEEIRKNYILWRHAEVHGGTQDETKALYKKLCKAADGLRFLACFNGAADDVAADIGSRLKKQYARTPVTLAFSKFVMLGERNRYVPVFEDRRGGKAKVRLDNDLLREISRNVDCSLGKVKLELDRQDGGGKIGDALMILDASLAGWFEKTGHHAGISKNDARDAPLYQRFIFFMDHTCPKDLWSFTGTVASAASRIIEARKRAQPLPCGEEKSQ